MSFTVFYCTSCIAFFLLLLLLCLSVCVYVFCLCLWATLPELNEMMMICQWFPRFRPTLKFSEFTAWFTTRTSSGAAVWAYPKISAYEHIVANLPLTMLLPSGMMAIALQTMFDTVMRNSSWPFFVFHSRTSCAEQVATTSPQPLSTTNQQHVVR